MSEAARKLLRVACSNDGESKSCAKGSVRVAPLPAIGDRLILREVGFEVEVEVERATYDRETGLVCLGVVVCESVHTRGRLAPDAGERLTLEYPVSGAQLAGLFRLTPLAEHRARGE